jgi:hypothetical protein
MELITLGIGYIVNTFAKNKEVHSVFDDFVTESAKWVRSWFRKNDLGPLIQKLEEKPESEDVKAGLSSAMGGMVQDDKFKAELKKWVDECKKPIPSMKNVLEDIEIDVKGHINIGDKSGSDQVYDKKNVVKAGKIKGGGDFNLGDM